MVREKVHDKRGSVGARNDTMVSCLRRHATPRPCVEDHVRDTMLGDDPVAANAWGRAGSHAPIVRFRFGDQKTRTVASRPPVQGRSQIQWLGEGPRYTNPFQPSRQTGSELGRKKSG